SGNDASGLEIFGASATGNVVKGNFIGLNGSGTGDLGNSLDGIEIEMAIKNTIGGTTAKQPQNISRNTNDAGENQRRGATANVIQGNYIGTNTAGTADLGNTLNGVNINGVAGNTVGGTTSTPGTGAGNVISGNNSSGVQIFGDAADSNSVLGNIIGLNA